MNALGNQVAVDLYDCGSSLNDLEFIRSAMLKSAKAGKATVIGEKFHRYAPQGVSGMVIIAESHIAVHTWPEFAYAAVDIFTCGNTVDVWAIKDSLAEAFTAGNVTVVELKRGLIREPVPDQYPRVNPPSIK